VVVVAVGLECGRIVEEEAFGKACLGQHSADKAAESSSALQCFEGPSAAGTRQSYLALALVVL
jgi:hypothetical protein